MIVISQGEFGKRVHSLLAEQGIREASRATRYIGLVEIREAIFITDSLRPSLIANAFDNKTCSAAILCFLTSRGLYVSPWLSLAGPCFDCFQRRWFGNLSFWEHEPVFERYMEQLDQELGTRSFPVPHTVINIAARFLMDRIGSTREVRSHYVDLLSGEISSGLVMCVHGCKNGCHKNSGLRANLAEILAGRK